MPKKTLPSKPSTVSQIIIYQKKSESTIITMYEKNITQSSLCRSLSHIRHFSISYRRANISSKCNLTLFYVLLSSTFSIDTPHIMQFSAKNGTLPKVFRLYYWTMTKSQNKTPKPKHLPASSVYEFWWVLRAPKDPQTFPTAIPNVVINPFEKNGRKKTITASVVNHFRITPRCRHFSFLFFFASWLLASCG